MLIYSNQLTRAQLDAIAERMPVVLFDTDPDFGGPKRRRIKVLIRPSHAPEGEQWRKIRVQFTGRERRIFACSWAAHYVFYAALLALDPDAEIRSQLAHWKGAGDYYARVGETGSLNWGSMFMPQYPREMCHEPKQDWELRQRGEEIALELGAVIKREEPGRTVYTLQQATVRACPHFIISPEHYHPDGRCRCHEPDAPQMVEWGYAWDAQEQVWA